MAGSDQRRPKAKGLRVSLYLATRGQGHRRPSAETDGDREREGIATKPRPDGPLVWIDSGADSGAFAARELIARILDERDDLTFLITTTANARSESTPEIISQFAPNDSVHAARRFLDHWQPDVAVWTELDLRPALIARAHDASVPLILVEAYAARGRADRPMSKGVSKGVLALFQSILVGDRRSAARLRQMGVGRDRVEVLGFLQEGTPALRCNETEREDLATMMAGRPTWLAAQVADDELDAVLEAHAQASRRSHRLLLFLVPDDPAKAARYAEAAHSAGFTTAIRSEGDEPDRDVQVYLADLEGEMGLWYRMAPFSYLGSSFASGGGMNPFEAAALGSAIVHGPHVDAHHAEYDRLLEAGAARPVRSVDELCHAVEALLSPARAAEMARLGWEVSSAGSEVTDRVIDLILTAVEDI